MKHFTLEELTRSNTAAQLKIDNHPAPEAVSNLYYLAEKVLDPLRELLGQPVRVTSGYRCPALNKAVGGAGNSFHLTGCAADLDNGSREENQRLFDLIRSRLPFTELGWEGGGQWVHVAIQEGREQEKEIFYA